MNKQEFYEQEELRVRTEIECTDPNDENYPVLLARLDQIDNHKNLMIERQEANRRRTERGFGKWISALSPNTVVEVLGGTLAYLGGIKLVTALEKNGGAFISGAKGLFSKIKLKI